METETLIKLNCIVEPGRLSLKAAGESGRFDIIDEAKGFVLGSVRQAPDSKHVVELFWGKGGFMGMVTSPTGAKYFALPGSSISVGGVELVLEGPAITSNPSRKASERKPFKPQTLTAQATILGAGLATRFERISGDSTNYSKPAVPLAGTCTVIECIANALVAHGFRNLIVNTYFKPHSLKNGLSRCDGAQVGYIDENEPSGTAGGLRKMLMDERYKGLLDESKPLLVVQGDSVTDADFSSLMEAHAAQDALLTIGCQVVDDKDVDKFGIIVTDNSGADGQSGKIQAFQEKPKLAEAKSRLGNTGFYIFSPKAYPLVREIYTNLLNKAQQEARAAGQAEPQDVQMDFATDVFPVMLQKSQAEPSLGAFWAQAVEGYWSDIGNPVQYLESVHDLYEGKVNIPLPENREQYYRNGILFWEGAAEVAEREGARLAGNVIVAKPFE